MRLLLHILKTDCFAPLFCSVLFSLDHQPPPQRDTMMMMMVLLNMLLGCKTTHFAYMQMCGFIHKKLAGEKKGGKQCMTRRFFLQSGVGRRKTRFDVTFMNAHVHTLALSFRSGSSSTMENWGKSCVRVCFVSQVRFRVTFWDNIICSCLREWHSVSLVE